MYSIHRKLGSRCQYKYSVYSSIVTLKICNIKWTSSLCISFLRVYFKWLPCHITLKCLVHERPFMNSILRVSIFSCSAFSTSSFSRISATLEYFYDEIIINIMVRAYFQERCSVPFPKLTISHLKVQPLLFRRGTSSAKANIFIQVQQLQRTNHISIECSGQGLSINTVRFGLEQVGHKLWLSKNMKPTGGIPGGD